MSEKEAEKAEGGLSEAQAKKVAEVQAAQAEADKAQAEYEAALTEQIKLYAAIDRGEIGSGAAEQLKASEEKVQALQVKAADLLTASSRLVAELKKEITGKKEKLERAYQCSTGMKLGRMILKLAVQADQPDYTEKLNALYDQRAKYTTGPNDHYAINSYIRVAGGWKELMNAYSYYQHAFNEWYLHVLSLSALHTLRACRMSAIIQPLLDSGAKLKALPPKGYNTLTCLLEAEEKSITKGETYRCIVNAAKKMIALDETARMISQVFLGEDNALPLDTTGKERGELFGLMLNLKLITAAQPEYFKPLAFDLKAEDLMPKPELLNTAKARMCKADITSKDFIFSVFPYVRYLCGEGYYMGGPLV